MSNTAPTENQGKAHRYLAGQMSAEETAEFENYMLEHPEVLDDIELLRRMKSGLASLRRNGELDDLVRSRRSLQRFHAALAASLIVAVGFIGWYLFARHGEVTPVFSASAESFADRAGSDAPPDEFLLARNRSGSSPALELPASPRLALLRVVTGAAESATVFDLELARSSPAPQKSLGRIENVQADAQGMVSAYLDPQALGAGTFNLRVHRHDPTGGAGEVTDYPFEIR
jgi:hypothetical protein